MMTALCVAREAGMVQPDDRLLVLSASLQEHQRLSIDLNPVADDRCQMRDDVTNGIGVNGYCGNGIGTFRKKFTCRTAASSHMEVSELHLFPRYRDNKWRGGEIRPNYQVYQKLGVVNTQNVLLYQSFCMQHPFGFSLQSSR
jgi:hypothetical protein